MDYLAYNSRKRLKTQDYQNNVISIPLKKTKPGLNSYSHYLIPSSKGYINSLGKQNNNVFHEIIHKNRENPLKNNKNMINFLTENNIKRKYSKNVNNITPANYPISKQYSYHPNLKNKYINDSPQKRNSYNYEEKNESVKNAIATNVNQVNIHNNGINKFHYNQNKKNKIKNNYEKDLLLNKLTSSKSTKDFFGQDILIEYDNGPKYELKRKINNKYLSKSKDYLFKNQNLNNINNFSYENMNNDYSYIIEKSNNKKIKYISQQNKPKNNEYLCDNFFDADVSCIGDNYGFIDDKKDKDFFSHNNSSYNFNNNDYNLKKSSGNCQISNKVFDVNNNYNYNININQANQNDKIFKIKKTNTEYFKNKNNIKKKSKDYLNIDINKSFHNSLKEVKERTKNHIIKSKKDIFPNKEITNVIKLGNYKFKKRASPEPKNNLYNNQYYINFNQSKTTKNINDNNNIFLHISEDKSFNNKRNINNNIQNNLYEHNILTEKNNNNINLFNYRSKGQQDISNINYDYNLEDNNHKEGKKSNLNKYQSIKDNNINYIENKFNTSRYDISKIDAQNLILSSENNSLNGFNCNLKGYQSSKNFSKSQQNNKIINNNLSKNGKAIFSPPSALLNTSDIYQKNYRNKNLNENNKLKTEFEKNKKIKDIKEINKLIVKTEGNAPQINNNENSTYVVKNKNKEINEKNDNILKNIKINRNINNISIKLYVNKKNIKNNKDIIKQYNEIIKNNKFDNNSNRNNINEIKQSKSTFNNKLIINNNIINSNNKNSNIININNTTSNVNILNVKNNSINICIDKNDKYNISYPNKSTNTNNMSVKSNILNVKNKNKENIKNQLFLRNKNFKNIKFVTPISKNTRKINNSNSNNYPSFIKMQTNEIKNNDSFWIKTQQNAKSNQNILYKGNASENNYKIKQMILNNSSQILYYDNKFDTDFIEERNSNDGNKMDFNLTKDNIMSIKDNLILKNESNLKNSFNNRNNNLSKDNIYINRSIKTPITNNNINLFNFKDKIKAPMSSNSNQILSQKNNEKQNVSKIYIKPFGLVSKSKSKEKNRKKSRSVLKIKKSNHSVRYINKKKTIERINSKIKNYNNFFKTSPLFYQKNDYFQSEFGSIKKGSTSLNTSHITKYENSSYKTKENDFTFDNNSTIINYIREPFKKGYFFVHKIYNYFIKYPSLDACYISKIYFKKENYNSNKNNSRICFRKKSMNFYEGKDKYYNEIINIDKNNYNTFEESDLEIYKNLQKKIKNDSDSEKQNFDKLLYNDKELLHHETIKKLEDLNKNYASKIYIKKNQENNLNKENINVSNISNCKTYDKKSKYSYLEEGIKILSNLALKKGLKTSNRSLDNHLNNSYDDKKDDNTIFSPDKLKTLFSKEKERDNNNLKNKEYNLNPKNKNKFSISVNTDIARGINKIENLFGKNNINIIINNSYENNNNEFNFKERENQKLMNYLPDKKSELNRTNDENDINFILYKYDNNINNYNYYNNARKKHKYRESKSYLNKNNNTKETFKIKGNNLNNHEKIKFNNNLNIPLKYIESISYSDEEAIKFSKTNNSSENKSDSKDNSKLSNNNSNNSEDFDNYLSILKKNKNNNILKQDITFLLNILSKGNYNFILKQITQIILYKIDKSKDINKNSSGNKILNSNNDIIYNEHLFKSIIFKEITKGVKYACIFAKLCFDLNNNILNGLIEQKNSKNNKERNLKVILNDECINIMNNFKKEECKNFNNGEDIEYYFFKNKIIGFVSFVYELIFFEMLKQQFGIYVLEQLLKFCNNENINYAYIYLEGIVVLCNKLGKLTTMKDNQKLILNINNFVDNNLKPFFDSNNNDINICLKYKIMNLIIKRENKWKDSLYELYIEEEKNKLISEFKNIQNNYIVLEKPSTINKGKEQSIHDINMLLIKEDITNYISYFTEENKKGQINIKKDLDKSYNWKVIDDLVNNKNFGLESIINYFINICSSINYDDTKILLCNDYIKNIIEFYANNLSKKSIDSLQNEMIKTFSNINDIVEANKEMYKILGNLLFILIDNKLYHIKFFNHYLKEEKQTQINLAIVTKYCIISAGKFAKKYLNDFKQTKLFINNDIFEKYVIENMQDLLYFMK